MEAPEKIWMNDDWVHQFDDKDFMGEDSVEYTRTDAFIDKAVKFLKPTVYVMCCGNRQDADEYIKDFKNYMKGE